MNNSLYGEATQSVAVLLATLQTEEVPSTLKDNAVALLEGRGWTCYREQKVRCADGRGGRVDVVAGNEDDEWVAIEFDNTRPKDRSVAKLVACNCGRVIVLRKGIASCRIPGIDHIVSVRPRA